MADLVFDTHESDSGNLSKTVGSKNLIHTSYDVSAVESNDSVKIDFSGTVFAAYTGVTQTEDVAVARYCSDWLNGTDNNIIDPVRVVIGSRTFYPGRSINGFTTSGIVARTHDWQSLLIKSRLGAEGKVTNQSTSGNTFDNLPGWDCGSRYYNEIEVLIAPKDSYEIAFDANGGDQEQCPGALTKWYGEELAIPECVMASDFGRFVGWSLTPTGGVAFPGGTVPAGFNEGATLYAIWDSGSYELVLEPDFDGAEPITYVREVGTAYVLEPCPFTRRGFDFAGWSTSPFEKAAFPDGAIVCIDASDYSPVVPLYARWARGAPAITWLACDRKDASTATVEVGFSLFHAGDFDEQDAPAAKVRVTATPRSAKGAADVVVAEFEGVPERGADDDPFYIGGLLEDVSYDLLIEVIDGIDPALLASASSVIGTAACTLDFARGGKGVGVLMRCPEGSDNSPKGVHVNAEDGLVLYGLEGDAPVTLEGLLESVARKAALASHPIGSYWWSDDPTDPGDIIGGEWDRVKDVFLYAAGSKEVTGNAKDGGEEAHKLTTSELPSHYHDMSNHTHDGAFTGDASHGHTPSDTSKSFVVQDSGGTLSHAKIASGSTSTYNYINVGASNKLLSRSGSTSTASITMTAKGKTDGPSNNHTTKAGEDLSHNNMPPFKVAYCWRRVA